MLSRSNRSFSLKGRIILWMRCSFIWFVPELCVSAPARVWPVTLLGIEQREVQL